MAHIQEFIKNQSNLAHKITNAFVNFKKTGQAKMTEAATKVRIDRLASWWNEFTSNHSSFVTSPDNIDMSQDYFKNNGHDLIEETYMNVLSEFHEHLDSFSCHNSDQASNSGLAEMNRSRDQGLNDLQRARLKPIELPLFTGNILEWRRFRDLFTSTVVNSSSFSNVVKFYYLQTNIAKDALALIQDIPLSEDNFTRAWETLVDNYENLRRMVHSHLSLLFVEKPISSATSSEVKRLLTNTSNPLIALEALNRHTDHWDDLIVFLTTSRLDSESRKEWETSQGASRTPPTWDEMKTFLTTRILTLEAIENSERAKNVTIDQSKEKSGSKNNSKGSTSSHVTNESKKLTCAMCKAEHYLNQCMTFKSKSLPERKDFVKNSKLCYNCLGYHPVNKCKSSKRCQTCHRKHHSTLHDDQVSDSVESDTIPSTQQLGGISTQVVSATVSMSPKFVLLPTAYIYVVDSHGRRFLARALIDQCSQASFISEHLSRELNLPREFAALPVSGINNNTSTTKGVTRFNIRPRFHSDFDCDVEAFIIPKISNYQPLVKENVSQWGHLSGLNLGDPNFSKKSRIDLLLGGAIYSQILETGLRKGNSHHPIAFQTKIGWLVSGETKSTPELSCHTIYIPTVLNCTVDLEVDKLLEKFWSQEELKPVDRLLTPEEKECEEHFSSTHSRDPSGRYIVYLPRKTGADFSDLGDSYSPSLKMLQRMERRFKSNEKLGTAYRSFMREYEDLEHMRKVPIFDLGRDKRSCFYLPHHGVLREKSTTTKLRTVFNGSFRTDRGVSINDLLHVGPNLLPSIPQLVTSWRRYEYAWSADMEKAFRQISVHESDWHLQMILWREDPNLPVDLYYLTTITYGLNCSPYLTNRVIKQLAHDEKNRFPLAAQVLEEEIYADDTPSGEHNLALAIRKQDELINLCKVGGFNIRKWVANHPALLQLPREKLAADLESLTSTESLFSVLGLQWQPSSDTLHISFQIESVTGPWTKRKVLSCIAKFFDPLGWCAPVIVTAKIFMQKLWLLKIGWDTELPTEEQEQWSKWYRIVSEMEPIQIPRWINFVPESASYELHGFSDASKHAYGAVVYLRVAQENRVTVSILEAKTRVAPLKSLSIPKLELSATHLLAKLAASQIQNLKISNLSVHLWTDSMDVLYWLRDVPSRWPTFVANRCSNIHTLLPRAILHHVRSEENSADVASRGLSPDEFGNFQLWWRGPLWLHKSAENWPATKLEGGKLSSNPEHIKVSQKSKEIVASSLNVGEANVFIDLINEKSSLRYILKITSYVLRFITYLRRRCSNSRNENSIFKYGWMNLPLPHVDEVLLSEELERARLFLVWTVQNETFSKEMDLLTQEKKLSKAHPIISLNPMTFEGILRVGGRITRALINFEQKHQAILPSDHRLTELVIKESHIRTLHGGTQLTLTTLRLKYWIIHARKTVKTFIQKCSDCIRYRASPMYHIMGNLPAHRVQPSKPFQNTGVDYAGPFLLRSRGGRGYSSYKGYIAVFVCLSTRAVHLEPVSDYTSDGFIAAFRRFVSRRGVCSNLHSDNGSNFVGADAELKKMYSRQSDYSKELRKKLNFEGTNWHFNPPSAPHFGGIWEAAVKSVKHHLKRTVGDSKLTFEEMQTLLCQIEACLNSRPIAPLSDDPTDIQALTPAHFLIQSPSFLVPEPDYTETKIPAGKRWIQVQKMMQDCWKRWSTEYLQHLQRRSKWTVQGPTIAVGDLVLLKGEKFTSPCEWPLARVTRLHPGTDGVTRVVTVQTAEKSLDRPVVKLVRVLSV